MKQMIYKNESIAAEILHHDTYKGHQFFVVSYGSHPCCYVVVNPTVDTNAINCHGGITYTGEMDFDSFGTFTCIGWDYAHLGDYSGFFPHLGGRTYSTSDMITDCHNVIDQL